MCNHMETTLHTFLSKKIKLQESMYLFYMCVYIVSVHVYTHICVYVFVMCLYKHKKMYGKIQNKLNSSGYL